VKKAVAATQFVILEFGPLLVFWTLTLTVGVKAAILGSLIVIVVDAAWRRWRGAAFTRLYVLISALTLVFGAIDLLATQPFMLVYEAPITNVVTGLAFVVGAFGAKPMIQEVAEQQQSAAFPDTAEVRAFFRLFTLAWAAYFFLKAAFYLWVAAALPMTEAMALRSIVGGVSLALMSLISATQGRRLFFLCRRLGWLPRPDESARAT